MASEPEYKRKRVKVDTQDYDMECPATVDTAHTDVAPSAEYHATFTIFSGAQDPSDPKRDTLLPTWDDMQKMVHAIRAQLVHERIAVTADHVNSRIVGRLVDVFLNEQERSMHAMMAFPGITPEEKLGLELVKTNAYSAASAEWWPSKPGVSDFRLRTVTITNLPRSSAAHRHDMPLMAALASDTDANNLTTTGADHKVSLPNESSTSSALVHMQSTTPAADPAMSVPAADAPLPAVAQSPAVDTQPVPANVAAAAPPSEQAMPVTTPEPVAVPGGSADSASAPMDTASDASTPASTTADKAAPAPESPPAVDTSNAIASAPVISDTSNTAAAPGLHALLSTPVPAAAPAAAPAPTPAPAAATAPSTGTSFVDMGLTGFAAGQQQQQQESAPMDIAVPTQIEVASFAPPAVLRDAPTVLAEPDHPLGNVSVHDVFPPEVASHLTPEEIGQLSVMRTADLNAAKAYTASQTEANNKLQAEVAALRAERDASRAAVQTADPAAKARESAKAVARLTLMRDRLWRQAEKRVSSDVRAVCASLFTKIAQQADLSEDDVGKCDLVVAAVDVAVADLADAQQKELAATRAEVARLEQHQAQLAAVGNTLSQRAAVVQKRYAQYNVLRPDGTFAAQQDPDKIFESIKGTMSLPPTSPPTLASVQGDDMMKMFAKFMEFQRVNGTANAAAAPVTASIAPAAAPEVASFDSAAEARADMQRQQLRAYGTVSIAQPGAYDQYADGVCSLQVASFAPDRLPYTNGFVENAHGFVYGFETRVAGMPGCTVEKASVDTLFGADATSTHQQGSSAGSLPAVHASVQAQQSGESRIPPKAILEQARMLDARNPTGYTPGAELQMAPYVLASFQEGGRILYGSQCPDLPAYYRAQLKTFPDCPVHYQVISS